MARIEDIERRLLSWARWRVGGSAGGLGYASVDMASEGIRESAHESVIPIIECDAELTHRAVMALADELRATVEVVYLRGGGMRAKAARLGCSESTVWARVDRAHRLIQQWLSDEAIVRREQRRRVEALQQAARPRGV